MDAVQQSIIKTVAYFDLFHYPMTTPEIMSFMDTACTEKELNTALAGLLKEKVLFKTKDFFQLKHDDSLTSERIKANKLAEAQLVKAKKIAAFLAWFPYIKGIAVSGSLSKKIATKESDYDFFIITAYNRLWLCRFIFSLFIKAAALLGLRKYFCLNYVIDESYLEVKEKNIFTATEIATLMPMYGGTLFTSFFAANNWIYDFFPNRVFTEQPMTDHKKNIITRSAEWLMNSRLGEKADNAIMHFFDKRWAKLKSENKVTESGFLLGSMMVNKHYARPYPQHYQQKVLLKLQDRIQNIYNSLCLDPAFKKAC
ncbi:hypothetical protein BH10BAC2_BH10BAC2_47890 [soil metagenome]